jgi:hypothetical protein
MPRRVWHRPSGWTGRRMGSPFEPTASDSFRPDAIRHGRPCRGPSRRLERSPLRDKQGGFADLAVLVIVCAVEHSDLRAQLTQPLEGVILCTFDGLPISWRWRRA